MTIHDLPKIDASLNSLSAVFIVIGWFCIRAKKKNAHRFFMLSAVVTSALFLGCYLTNHALNGVDAFVGPHIWHVIYLVILVSHSILATVIVPLVILTLIPAFRRNFVKHRRIARWTFPIWLYVSVTGVIVYFMLYQWFAFRNIPIHH